MHPNALIVKPKGDDSYGGGIVESDVRELLAGEGMKGPADRVDGSDVWLDGEPRFMDKNRQRIVRRVVQFA